MRFSGNRLCQEGFSRSRRADKQCSFRELRTYLCVLRRIVQKVHDFNQTFFRFVFSGYIFEGDSRLLLHVHLCVGLSDAHNPAAGTADSLCHAVHKPKQKHKRKHHTENNLNDEAGVVRPLSNHFHIVLIKSLNKLFRIRIDRDNEIGACLFRFLPRRLRIDYNLPVSPLHLRNKIPVYHGQKARIT